MMVAPFRSSTLAASVTEMVLFAPGHADVWHIFACRLPALMKSGGAEALAFTACEVLQPSAGTDTLTLGAACGVCPFVSVNWIVKMLHGLRLGSASRSRVSFPSVLLQFPVAAVLLYA